MKYRRMPIEEESPEEFGYDRIRYNLSESSVATARSPTSASSCGDLLLFYGDHLGDSATCAALSRGAGRRRCRPTTCSSRPAPPPRSSSSPPRCSDQGDHLVVVRPNYATNIETPRAIGADVSFLDLRFEDGFRVDLEKLGPRSAPAHEATSASPARTTRPAR